METLLCSCACPLLVEARSHAQLTSRSAGTKLLVTNAFLLGAAALLLLRRLPYLPPSLQSACGASIVVWYFFMRRMRRLGIAESLPARSGSALYTSSTPLLAWASEFFSHGVLPCCVPRDDARRESQPASPADAAGCYCNPLGICALAQEARHVRDSVAEEIDFITHQSYSSFHKRHVFLRRSSDRRFLSHLAAVSQLSRLILGGLAASLAVVVVAADLSTGASVAAVALSMVQSWVFLRAFYWRRPGPADVPVDTVVKMFACGFAVANPLALVVETLLHRFLEEAKGALFTRDQNDTALNHVVTIFLFSFLCASFCEESIKYYAVVMTRVPPPFPNPSAASKTRRAAACRTYFVASALGFAAAENMLLVLGGMDYTKFVTLVIRFFLPIHLLCGAITSVRVVAEDIECEEVHGDSERNTMRGQCSLLRNVIKPSFVLHGIFDFLLLGLDYFLDGHTVQTDVDSMLDGSNSRASSSTQLSIVVGAASGVLTMCFGLIYYIKISADQERRLKLDELTAFGSSLHLLSDEDPMDPTDTEAGRNL